MCACETNIRGSKTEQQRQRGEERRDGIAKQQKQKGGVCFASQDGSAAFTLALDMEMPAERSSRF